MRIFACLIALVFLCSCAKFEAENSMIQADNEAYALAFASAIEAAGLTEDSGDDIAVAMFFGLGLGRKEYFRPETTNDYLKSFLPYVGLFMPYFYTQKKSTSMTAGRDIYLNSSRSTQLQNSKMYDFQAESSTINIMDFVDQSQQLSGDDE